MERQPSLELAPGEIAPGSRAAAPAGTMSVLVLLITSPRRNRPMAAASTRRVARAGMHMIQFAYRVHGFFFFPAVPLIGLYGLVLTACVSNVMNLLGLC